MGNLGAVPHKLYVSMANYEVFVMTSNLIFLAFWIFNYYLLVSAYTEFWPWFVSGKWAASLYSQKKVCLTMQARFLRCTYITVSSAFAFIILMWIVKNWHYVEYCMLMEILHSCFLCSCMKSNTLCGDQISFMCTALGTEEMFRKV